ncbi:MAG: MBL fold metallo-hydrolase [Crenarchaeota archaeon]|nr:MBL fold metallo-hydrolase [Thermoproteota archaeon]
MHTQQVGEKTFQIDIQTGGLQNLIASFVIKAEKIAIIDCGPPSSIPTLLEGLKELDIKPEDIDYIALTHVHVDHSGGVGTLLKKAINAKIIVHTKGVAHLINPKRLWIATKETLMEVSEIFGEPEAVPEDRIIIGSENMIIDLGEDTVLRILETPGHASHNLSYYENTTRSIFPGEAAGAYFPKYNIVLPTTPPPFRPDIALNSIAKLISLEPELIYYPHFGKATDAVKRLKDYANQIRLWLKIVEEGIQKDESNQKIRKRLFEEDTTLPKELKNEIVKAINSNPIHKRTLYGNSIDGFIDYTKKQRQ